VDYRYPTDKGLRYNDSWGYLNRWEIGEAGDTIHKGREALNTRINQYHKPMFTIRDYWNVSDKLYVSNIAYLSIGTGGGTSLFKTPSYLQRDDNGQYDLQLFYDINKSSSTGQASNYIRKMYNSHFWYGFLSNFTYKHNEDIEYSGGIDLRDYKGIHYTEVYDLLGAQYTRNDGDKNRDSKENLEEGAKVNYYYDGLVRWGGAYGQVKYNGGNFTAFLNLSAAYSGYQRVDYFAKKEITVGDTVLQVGYADTVNYNGAVYTRDSEGLEHKNSGWKWLPGFTVKGGINYNLNENMNVFCNLGYLSRTPRFNNVIDYNNCEYTKAVSITEPTDISANYYYQDPSCIGNNDGFIEFEVVGGIEPYTFIWDEGMSPTPNIEHLKEGSYLISVVDNNECYKEFGPIVLVDYDEECLKVPNAFTPNEDGVNDTWILENIELYPQATVNVYNKWGQKMYEARGAENPWDGTYNGKLLPTSTYLYVINLYDGSKPVTGTVTIIH